MSDAELAAELAKAQAEFGGVTKTKTANVPMKTGGSYSYKYADLADVMAAVRPALAAHGIALMQPIMGDELHTVLAGHGAEFRSVMPLHLEGLQPQAVGSLLTYYKRYAVTSMLGIAADEDDDGQRAQDSGTKQGSWQGGTRFPKGETKLISDPQVNLVRRLLKEVVYQNEEAAELTKLTGRSVTVEQLTAGEARVVIDALKADKANGRTPDGAIPSDPESEPF